MTVAASHGLGRLFCLSCCIVLASISSSKFENFCVELTEVACVSLGDVEVAGISKNTLFLPVPSSWTPAEPYPLKVSIHFPFGDFCPADSVDVAPSKIS